MPSLLFTHVVIARKTLNGVSEQTLARFAARARKAAGLDGAVAVLLTGNDEMLNAAAMNNASVSIAIASRLDIRCVRSALDIHPAAMTTTRMMVVMIRATTIAIRTAITNGTHGMIMGTITIGTTTASTINMTIHPAMSTWTAMTQVEFKVARPPAIR